MAEIGIGAEVGYDEVRLIAWLADYGLVLLIFLGRGFIVVTVVVAVGTLLNLAILLSPKETSSKYWHVRCTASQSVLAVFQQIILTISVGTLLKGLYYKSYRTPPSLEPP